MFSPRTVAFARPGSAWGTPGTLWQSITICARRGFRPEASRHQRLDHRPDGRPGQGQEWLRFPVLHGWQLGHDDSFWLRRGEHEQWSHLVALGHLLRRQRFGSCAVNVCQGFGVVPGVQERILSCARFPRFLGSRPQGQTTSSLCCQHPRAICSSARCFNVVFFFALLSCHVCFSTQCAKRTCQQIECIGVLLT